MLLALAVRQIVLLVMARWNSIMAHVIAVLVDQWLVVLGSPMVFLIVLALTTPIIGTAVAVRVVLTDHIITITVEQVTAIVFVLQDKNGLL